MAEYRVDELARAAGTSVRNVRVYQDRGLLPPPRRVGRTGVYTDAHLARLRLIRVLLQRGYTFATIGELIAAWSTGQGIAGLLGLEDALAVPWSDERPIRLGAAELTAALGPLTAEDLRQADELGLITADDGGYRVLSPRLLEAGARLVAAGVPPAAMLELAGEMQAQLEQVAKLLFKVFDRYVGQDGRPAREVTAALIELRPFAQQAVDALLAIALNRESERLLERRARRSRDANPGHRAGPA